MVDDDACGWLLHLSARQVVVVVCHHRRGFSRSLNAGALLVELKVVAFEVGRDDVARVSTYHVGKHPVVIAQLLEHEA